MHGAIVVQLGERVISVGYRVPEHVFKDNLASFRRRPEAGGYIQRAMRWKFYHTAERPRP